MDGPIVRVPSHITMDGARQIARLKRVGCLLVSEGQRLLGILGTDDWNRAPKTDPVWRWMRRLNAMGDVTPDTDAREALTVMIRQGTPCLVVAAGALVLGVVTEGRLRSALGATIQNDNQNDNNDGDDDLPWAAAG